MIIVTSGTKYTDVDVLACATAYSDLLNLLNKPATAVLYGPLNASITKTVKSWKLNYKSRHSPKPKDCFVLVDTSNPDVFLNKMNRFFSCENLNYRIDIIKYKFPVPVPH